MRAVVQRVSRACVRVEDETVGSIGHGLVLLVAIEGSDGHADADVLVEKVANLRIFPDDASKMNRSLLDAEGEILLVSQFTLAGDLRRGRRPSFTRAAPPEQAARDIDDLADRFRTRGIGVATGRFGAMMEVDLVNDGPVTFVIDVHDGKVR